MSIVVDSRAASRALDNRAASRALDSRAAIRAFDSSAATRACDNRAASRALGPDTLIYTTQNLIRATQCNFPLQNIQFNCKP